MSLSAGARFPMYRRTTFRAAMSCVVQPVGIGPVAAEADAAGLGAMDMLAPALAAALGAALGAGAALPPARVGPKVQPAPVVAGAQAANPAAATRPPPVRAAFRRNLRRERANSSEMADSPERASSSGSGVGRWSCGSVSIALDGGGSVNQRQVTFGPIP